MTCPSCSDPILKGYISAFDIKIKAVKRKDEDNYKLLKQKDALFLNKKVSNLALNVHK